MLVKNKVQALEDMARQFQRIGEDLQSILHEDISEEQKVEAVDKYFRTLLFTSTITEAAAFLYGMHEDKDTHTTPSARK
jgi:hypothetical protein